MKRQLAVISLFILTLSQFSYIANATEAYEIENTSEVEESAEDSLFYEEFKMNEGVTFHLYSNSATYIDS